MDVESIQTEVKVMEAKLRMSVRGLEDSDSAQGLDEQEAELACKRVYDETEKVVDFRKKRVTDTGLNKRITLPYPVDTRTEEKIQDLVNDLDEAILRAGREDESGRLRAGKQNPSSLNNDQQRGRENILKREREGELIVVLTDMSGKDEVDQAEKQFNGAAAQILKVFKVGEDWHHELKIGTNLPTVSATIWCQDLVSKS